MSTTTNGSVTIEDIALPQNNTNFGKEFKTMVDTIDTNFKSLRDQGGIYRGATGGTPSIVNVPLFEYLTDSDSASWYLTDTGWEVLECIFRSTEQYSLDSSYKYLIDSVGSPVKKWSEVKTAVDEDYPQVGSISATDFFEDSDGTPNSYWPMWSYLNDYDETQYSPCSPFAFYDPRTAELTSDDDVFLYEDTTSTSFVDTSCVLIGYLDTSTGSLNISTTYLFPTLYYDLNATNNDSTTEGAWCWMMNGRMTGIVAEGIPGSPAEARIHLITTSTDVTNTSTYKYLYNGIWYDKTEYDQLVGVGDGSVGWMLVSTSDNTDYSDYNAISHEIYVVQWNSENSTWETTSSTSPVSIDYNTDFFNYIWTPIAKTWAAKYTDYLTYVNNMKGQYGSVAVNNQVKVTPLRYDDINSRFEASLLYMATSYYIYIDETIEKSYVTENIIIDGQEYYNMNEKYRSIYIVDSSNTSKFPQIKISTTDNPLPEDSDIGEGWYKVELSTEDRDTTGMITVGITSFEDTVLIIKNNDYVVSSESFSGTEYYKLYTIVYENAVVFIDKTNYTRWYEQYSFANPIDDQSTLYIKDSSGMFETNTLGEVEIRMYEVDDSGYYDKVDGIGYVATTELGYYYDTSTGKFTVNGVEKSYKEFPANDWDDVSMTLKLPTSGIHIYKVEDSRLINRKDYVEYYKYDASNKKWEGVDEKVYYNEDNSVYTYTDGENTVYFIPRTYLPNAADTKEYTDVLNSLYIYDDNVMEYELNTELNSTLSCLPLYTILKTSDSDGSTVYEEQLTYAIRTVSSTDDEKYVVKIEKDAAYKYDEGINTSTSTHNIEISDFDNIYYNKPDGTTLNLKDLFNEYDMVCNNYVDINKYVSNSKYEFDNTLYKYVYIHTNTYVGDDDDYKGTYWDINSIGDVDTFKSIIGNESLTLSVNSVSDEGGTLYENQKAIINDLNISYEASGLNCLFKDISYMNNVNISIEASMDGGYVDRWTYLDGISELTDVIFDITISDIDSEDTFDIVDDTGKALFFNCKSMENCKIIFNINSVDDIKNYNIFGNYNFNRLFYNCYDNKGRITYDRFNVGDTTNSVYFKDTNGNLYDIYTYNITLESPVYNKDTYIDERGTTQYYTHYTETLNGYDIGIIGDPSNILFFNSDFEITTLEYPIAVDGNGNYVDNESTEGSTTSNNNNYGDIKYYVILELTTNGRLIPSDGKYSLLKDSITYIEFPKHIVDTSQLSNSYLVSPWGYDHWFDGWHYLKEVDNVILKTPCSTQYMFNECISLEKLTITLDNNYNDYIHNISDKIFYNCISLREVALPRNFIKLISSDISNFYGTLLLEIDNDAECYDNGVFKGKPYSIARECLLYEGDITTSINTYGFDDSERRSVFYVKTNTSNTPPSFNSVYVTETNLDGEPLFEIDGDETKVSTYNKFKCIKFFTINNGQLNISNIGKYIDGSTTTNIISLVAPYDWYEDGDGKYDTVSCGSPMSAVSVDLPDFSEMFNGYSNLESVVMYRYENERGPNALCCSKAFVGCTNINKDYLPDYLQDPYRGQSRDLYTYTDDTDEERYLDYLMFTKQK